MKKYRDLYEEEKRRHDEAFQIYQEGHMDEMQIISLHKRCNKKVPQPKKASSKSDEPKKAPKSLEFIDDPREEEQKSKKADEKEVATKVGKKVKKTSLPKKAPKLPELIDSSKEEEEEELDQKKKMSLLLGVKEEAQSIFDLRRDSKNLKIEKEVEKIVFIRGPYKGQELSNVRYVILNTSKRR